MQRVSTVALRKILSSSAIALAEGEEEVGLDAWWRDSISMPEALDIVA